MVSDLYGKQARTNVHARMITSELRAIEDGALLNVDKFRAFAYRHPALLFPAFQMQNALQDAILGRSFWERCANRRLQLGKGRTVKMATMAAMNVNSDLFNQTTGLDGDQNNAPLIHPKDQMAQLILQSTGTHAFRKSNAAKKAAAEKPNNASISIAGVDHAGQHDKDGGFVSPRTPKTHHTGIHNEKFAINNHLVKSPRNNEHNRAHDPLDNILKDAKEKHGEVKFVNSPKRKNNNHISPSTVEESEDDELELLLELPLKRKSGSHGNSRPHSSHHNHNKKELRTAPSGLRQRSGSNSPAPNVGGNNRTGKGDHLKGQRRQTFS